MSFTTGSTSFGIFDADPDFASDADKVVDYTRKKLGDPIMYVHMSSSQIYMSFEEACLEFSAITNQYQAKSALSQFLGSSTSTLSGSENTYQARMLEFQKRMAGAYAEEAGVNGPHPLHSASIDIYSEQMKYDLQAILSGSGVIGAQRIQVKDIFHFSPMSAYRFFGTTSAVNYLHNQFNFESFTPETIFYLLPIWEDILRGMQFKTSNKVRRSNYSYELHNNELTLYPCPSQDNKLYFTYMLPPDPNVPASPSDASFHGVANLSNVPFGNIQYSNLNSLSKHWIRRFAFALAKEVEGHIRSKMANIPIPNGDLTLNGPELIADGRADQEMLRTELKMILDDLTYDKLAARDAEMAESLVQTFAKIPLGIYIGTFWPLVGLLSYLLHDNLFRMLTIVS